jgi:glucose/arabinose dehydrogenase
MIFFINPKSRRRFYLAGLVLLITGIGLKREPALDISVQPMIAFPSLVFELPVGLVAPPDESNRVFVVEQKGVIKVFPNSPQVREARVFLDIRDRVFSGHSEEGLLGLAFHPDFKNNGYFYVYYTAGPPRRSLIARYQVSLNDPDYADSISETVILEISQPYGNHNGGQLAFGPEGYLYIALGDGGSGGDPHGHGQNRRTLLGAILRIDVDHSDGERGYSIPRDNPFFKNSQGFREEIYAYGLRNPWRFSFDPQTGWLWAADVGQDRPIEEVNIIKKGKNYGWNIMEGSLCYHPAQGCDQSGLEKPIWEYTNNEGRCIIGGFVYRGQNIHKLVGKYVYADFLSGRIWALTYNGWRPPSNVLLFHNPDLYISSFGVDQQGELYFCSFDGRVYTLVETASSG